LVDHDRVLPYLRTAVVNGCRMVHRRRTIVGRFIGDRETPFWSAEAAILLGETRREVFLACAAASPARGRGAALLPRPVGGGDLRGHGVSRGTVKSTISRALKALTAKLEGNR
jgi:hypothetical protein